MLGLEIDAPALSHSVLNEFRGRLLEGSQEQLLFETLVDHLKEQGWFKGSRRQRTAATHVLAAVRDLNRLEFVGETLRAALNDLATVAPEWGEGFPKGSPHLRHHLPNYAKSHRERYYTTDLDLASFL